MSARLHSCGDKGISVGEKSSIAMYDGEVTKATLGLASKDGSSFYSSDLRVLSTTSCFESYLKKPEFITKGLIRGSIHCE